MYIYYVCTASGCVDVLMHAYVYTSVCVGMCMCVCECTCVYVCVPVCAHACVYICVCVMPVCARVHCVSSCMYIMPSAHHVGPLSYKAAIKSILCDNLNMETLQGLDSYLNFSLI